MEKIVFKLFIKNIIHSKEIQKNCMHEVLLNIILNSNSYFITLILILMAK